VTECARPVGFETLVAWWTGELATDEAARVEEHLFACDACAGVSERFARLAAGVREHLPPIISPAQRDRLLARGTRIRVTPVDAGVDATAVFGPEVDLLVHALRVDLSRAQRVDVEIVMQGWSEPLLCEGIPFDVKSGEVLVCCQRHFQHMSPADPIFRVHVVESGERRSVGDYLVRHIWP
jgi:predicted anti-sigma-YlaC factor YlaD